MTIYTLFCNSFTLFLIIHGGMGLHMFNFYLVLFSVSDALMRSSNYT